ncbi:MAG TPA: DUF3800 domain-containing protein [Candidatus Aquilonibacter sp.]|jgi:hypothetical protein|nr:DUF3800 domain-containing protein [Candidatus Aquilonibacter sp.]
MPLVVYLDESGDLGWSFGAPFRKGGSSRYLTIAALCVPSEKKHLPKRVIKKLYEKFNWPIHVEKKWSMMHRDERAEFARTAQDFCRANADVHLHAITVKKENVQSHIRTDANKLYNYMIRLCLLNRMRQYPEVHIIPDPRSIKVQSGNSLPDYLQTLLWFHVPCTTILRMQPLESHECKGIQFADMLCGAIQSAFEDGNLEYLNTISPCLTHSRLYF